MKKQRTREEIMGDNAFPTYDWKRSELQLEVLLDIRDLLQPEITSSLSPKEEECETCDNPIHEGRCRKMSPSPTPDIDVEKALVDYAREWSETNGMMTTLKMKKIVATLKAHLTN